MTAAAEIEARLARRWETRHSRSGDSMTDPDLMDRLQLASLDADEARSWCRAARPPGPTAQERRIEQLEAELAALRERVAEIERQAADLDTRCPRHVHLRR